MKRKKIKPKIKINKLDRNPLFVQFLNWDRDKYTMELILERIKNSFIYDKDKKIVKELILDDDRLLLLDSFRSIFKKYMTSFIISKNISTNTG